METLHDTDMEKSSESRSSESRSVSESRGIKRELSPNSTISVEKDSTGMQLTTMNSVKRGRRTDDRDSVSTFIQTDLDDDGCIPGYDASKEELPPLAIYHPSFKKVEEYISAVCNVIIGEHECLKKNGYENEEIETVCNGIHGLASFLNLSKYYPVVGPVAVLGPAGAGKSSCTNSVLGLQNAAYEHDGQDTGTYVCTEYRKMSSNQVSRYRVTVPYYPIDDIGKDIIKHVKHINAHLFEDQDGGDMDQDEERSSAQKADTAFVFLMDLLCTREEFCTREAAEAYFDRASANEEDVTVADLLDGVKDFLDTRNFDSNNTEVYDLETDQELSNVIKQVSRPSKGTSKKSKEPSPWPVINKVVVHQYNKMLNAGVVLADTPGINDSNLTVVENTNRYLKQAGTILVFSSYKRISADASLNKILRECVALGKMDRTRLVITHIDDMKPYQEDDKDDLYPEDQALLTMKEMDLNKLKAAKLRVTNKKKAVKGVDNDLYATLDSELQGLTLAVEKANSALKQAHIEIRCRAIKASLENKLVEIDGSKHAPKLPISFISNTAYQIHVRGFDPKESPCLSIERTGIPGLRRELFAIPAYGKLQKLQVISVNRLPSIINGIHGILTKSNMERKAEVRKVIEESTGWQGDPASQLKREVQAAFKEIVGTCINNNEDDWIRRAVRELSSWESLNAGTFKGICQRCGVWEKHRSGRSWNWNNDLTKISAPKLTAAFNKLDDELETIAKEFRFDLRNRLFTLKTNLEELEAAQGMSWCSFFEYIDLIADSVVDDIIEKYEALQRNIGDIRHGATVEASDSYATAAMSETYQRVALMSAATLSTIPNEPAQTVVASGSGRRRRQQKRSIHQWRVQEIRFKLMGEKAEKGVFQDIGKVASDELASVLSTWTKACKKILEDAHGMVLQDFDRRFQEPKVKVKLEEDVQAVEALQRVTAAAMDIIRGPLMQHLTELKAYEANGEGGTACGL